MVSVDTAPSIERVNPSTDERTLHTIVPGSRIVLKTPTGWRVLAGIERMLLTGFPRPMLEAAAKAGHTDILFHDMAGNAFSGSIPLAIYICIMLNLTEKHKQDLAVPTRLATSAQAVDAYVGDVASIVGTW